MATVSNIHPTDECLTALLARLRRFAPISASDAHQLGQLLVDRDRYSRGDLILKLGDKTDKVYILSEGWAAQEIITEEGNTCILGFLLPGDTTTFNSELDSASDVTVKCLTEVSVVTFRANAVKALLAENANLTHAFSRMKLTTESMTRELLVNLTAKPADHKVAHLLGELSARSAQLPNSPHIPAIHLTQIEIGAALGLSSVHVNRVIKRMRDEELLEVHSGLILIKKWDEFATKFNFNDYYLTQHEVSFKKSIPGSFG
ncbi:Crp/Fnr family transcriptional regulator (plasmid) [Marinobacter nanhaiticus D15-8W]|uniref:Crp/Fnr family transcriptional regulator n=1 Tax=Marinobacter nanhaiticus D15-8W TaxID=626887 RepID=N6W3J0_9GAMM|nr:Crp/Fnr family transcriptional regulator [Marinobacter nanhaiticus]ENO17110.1 Crp/Fnr family transcriptional regulator [Marinobacter nanhaiticus D15-8W]BES73917.1 Crp/Fnr family transcriptional regulator [Marinobacter nanhaiticus D15-8W]